MRPNPYRELLESTATMLNAGKEWPLGGFPFPEHPPVAADAPEVLLLSPHPDDECIVGGLALRLMREKGFRVVNAAITLGRIPERRAGRWEELTNACRYLGFELLGLQEGGLERVNPTTRAEDPTHWEGLVGQMTRLLETRRPRVILFPHASDQNTGHMGVQRLVEDALIRLDSDFVVDAAETEFWSPMRAPNLLLEIGIEDATSLLTALSFHVGEVQRNPYHLRTTAWWVDNVRRGGEIVGVQGGTPPDFAFGVNYRWRRWEQGAWRNHWDQGVFLGKDADLDQLWPQ